MMGLKIYVKMKENGKDILYVHVSNTTRDESEFDYIFETDHFIDPVDILEFWRIEDGQLIPPAL